MVYYILFEAAAGYALFELKEAEEIGSQLPKVRQSWLDLKKFQSIVSLKAYKQFISPEQALENINDISEGILNDFLKEFLEFNISDKIRHKLTLGVSDSNLASAIAKAIAVKNMESTQTSPTLNELLRSIRYHFDYFIKQTSELASEEGYTVKTQRGLAHGYSRAKVKFNVNRADNMIIQSISLLDQLEKDVNTFSMRVREWYSWHFPELIKIVNDNILYARLARFIKNRKFLDESALPELSNIVPNETAKLIVQAAKSSMGYEVSDSDLKCVCKFADKVVQLAEFRANLSDYLSKRMYDVAPNLTTLVGETVGARLINHAGSLTTLAKYPASTVQILGAEKALFRALKSRGNTPKFGLIFNSTFITRAKSKDKGKISRYLANKCSIASRIDAFSELQTTKFGEVMRQQIEDRLKFYETGTTPPKNVDVMQGVLDELKAEAENDGNKKETDEDEQPDYMLTEKTPSKPQKKKTTKKHK